MNLTVEDEGDIKKAERTGDVEKMSPIRVDDAVAAQEMCQDAASARREGQRAAFAARAAAGGALAFWARALRLDREDDGPDDMALAAASLRQTSPPPWSSSGFGSRAEQAAFEGRRVLRRRGERARKAARFVPTRPRARRSGGTSRGPHSLLCSRRARSRAPTLAAMAYPSLRRRRVEPHRPKSSTRRPPN